MSNAPDRPLPIPYCEPCRIPAIAKETKYGERCFCPRCGRWSWGRKPLADYRTHEARKAAHAAFDPLWRRPAIVTRGQAYRLLQQALGLEPEDCHMALMDADTADLVPGAVLEILSRLDPDIDAFDNRCRRIHARP